jgi:plasmid stability protein
MASDDLVIANLTAGVRRRLEVLAAEHGTTPETEARLIIEAAVLRPNLADVANRLFGRKHGIELDLPPRHAFRLGRSSTREKRRSAK